jgi:hypothetical protein
LKVLSEPCGGQGQGLCVGGCINLNVPWIAVDQDEAYTQCMQQGQIAADPDHSLAAEGRLIKHDDKRFLPMGINVRRRGSKPF